MKNLKRLGTLLLAVVLILSLAACASSTNDTAEEQQETVTENPTQQDDTQTEEQPQEQAEEQPQEQTVDETTPDEATNGNGVLVVYFSRTGEQYEVGVIDKGNTAIVADMIIEATGADSFEIVPEEDYYPYTYDELIEIAKQEQNENARPAYAGEVPDLSRYDTIFIGAPVWWGDWPMICYTFFEENADALAGKTLIPFSTHGGSGLSGFDKKLASACPDSTIGEGLAIAGTDAQNNQDTVRGKVSNWLSEIGY